MPSSTYFHLLKYLSWIPVGILINDRVMSIHRVQSDSMEPNVSKGDIVLINKLFINTRAPAKRGYIYLYYNPYIKNDKLISRVVASENHSVPYPGNNDIIPTGYCWMNNDNINSKEPDSNEFGILTQSLIIGKVECILFPFDKLKILKRLPNELLLKSRQVDILSPVNCSASKTL